MRTDTDMSTNEAMTILRQRGIVKVDVHFSGGNDEGGADRFTATTADGTEVDLGFDTHAYRDSTYDTTTRSWRHGSWVVGSWDQETRKHSTRPATDAEVESARLRDALESPIYAEYGSFAGEFYVDGTCTWDVATGKSEMHGEYGSMSYDRF